MKSKVESKIKVLKILLNKFEKYINPKVDLEQYYTPKEVVIDLFLTLYNKVKNRKNKIAADFGSGTGRLTAMLLLLDFKKVYSIEKDREAFAVLKYNIENYMYDYLDKVELINSDVREFGENVDVVVSNPPFGVKRRGQDRIFIKKSLELSKEAFILGRPQSILLYKNLASEYGKNLEVLKYYWFDLSNFYPFHIMKSKKYKVALFHFY